MRTILVTAALAATGGAAFAQDGAPPAPPPPPAAEADDATLQDEIVVLADPGDQVRIDRRTYTLRDDPAAQATDMWDILGRIPAVSVSPGGAITLLGADNVAIQINGQPVPGDLETVLRGLNGGDIERIEVITNPSAQYSAAASGGIINIITKRRGAADGLNGVVRATLDSYDGFQAGASLTWTEGPWTLSGYGGRFTGGQDRAFERTRETFATGEITSEPGINGFSYDGWNVGSRAGYRFDDRRRASLALNTGEFEYSQTQSTELFGGAGAPLSSREIDGDNVHNYTQLVLDYEQKGERDREVLKFNAAFNESGSDNDSVVAFQPASGAPSAFRTRTSQDSSGGNIKLDLEQPLSDDWFLTWGGAFEYADEQTLNALSTITGPAPTPDYEALLDGRMQTAAAYATIQFTTGDWTWLPGVRGEIYRREVVSGGLETDTVDTRLFPTLHVRRELTDELNLDVSYTSRIARPGFGQLDPAIRYFDVDRASSGNPALEPTTTDAYELNLTYIKDGANFSLTFYDRISDDIVSGLTETTTDGIILSHPVNAGSSEQRGLQAMLRAPFAEGWRYSLTANLLSREFDYLTAGAIARRSELEYDGVAQIDYRDADQTRPGANQFQFEARFRGPIYGLQSETDGFITGNFTWRRRLTENIYAVLRLWDVFDTSEQRFRITTDDYFEETRYGGGGTRVMFSLAYQFGATDRPPQDEPMPSMPMQ